MPITKTLRGWLAAPARRILGQERLLDLFFGGYWLARDFSLRIPRQSGRIAKARIAVVSMWDEAQADLAEITGPNKASYCARHGYAWLSFTDGFSMERPTAWSKLLFLRRCLPDYDWIMWSDADSLITNLEKKIESFLWTKADLLLTKDRVGVNSGSFLIRNCRWARSFLDEAWDYPEHPSYRLTYDVQTDRLWENRAFCMLLRHSQHRYHTRILPQRALNSYLPGLHQSLPKGSYAPGDFVLHLAGVDHATRLRVLTDFSALSDQFTGA